MIIVGASSCWFQVVTTIEKLADIGTTSSLNNELATGMVGCIVGSVKNEIIKKQKVALTSSCNSIEFLLGNGNQWRCEFNKLAHKELMTDFKDDQRHEKLDWNADPEKCVLLALIVAVDTGCSSENSNYGHEP